MKRYRCLEAINEAVAKKSYSTGLIHFLSFSFSARFYVVGFMLLLSFNSVLVSLLLQIRLASQSCIILFTSLKVRRSILHLNWKLLMLNPKNRKGILVLKF